MSGNEAGKGGAGLLLGFPLALALTGIFFFLAPGDWPPTGGRYMLLRWLIPPMWLAILSASFMFRTAVAAWLWLGGATIVAFAVLAAVRLVWVPA